MENFGNFNSNQTQSVKLDLNSLLQSQALKPASSQHNTLIKELSTSNQQSGKDKSSAIPKTNSAIAQIIATTNSSNAFAPVNHKLDSTNTSETSKQPFVAELLSQGYDMGLAGLKGGTAGLLTGGPIPYTLSMLAKDVIHKYPDTVFAKSGDWYLRHFDKKTILDNRNKIVKETIAEETSKIDELAKGDSSKLAQTLKTIDKDGFIGQIDFEELDNLDKRTKWLNNPALLDKSLAKKNVLELEDLFKTEPKLFSKDELELLLKRQKAILESSKLEADMLEAEKVFGGKTAMIKNFSVGAGFDMGVFVVNDYVENFTHGNGLFTQWSTNMLFVPAEEFIPGGIYTKIAYGAAIIGGSQLLDHYIPTNKYNKLTEFLKPNNFDSILLVGASVMPVDGPIMRLALMGLSIIPGRIDNYLASKK